MAVLGFPHKKLRNAADWGPPEGWGQMQRYAGPWRDPPGAAPLPVRHHTVTSAMCIIGLPNYLAASQVQIGPARMPTVPIRAGIGQI